jgi:hypothetical protein
VWVTHGKWLKYNPEKLLKCLYEFRYKYKYIYITVEVFSHFHMLIFRDRMPISLSVSVTLSTSEIVSCCILSFSSVKHCTSYYIKLSVPIFWGSIPGPFLLGSAHAYCIVTNVFHRVAGCWGLNRPGWLMK